MKRYVVGFFFNDSMENVVLIKKNRPEWQIGLLNGPGGHIKKGESPKKAMTREFFEEAGIYFEDWLPLAVFEGLNGVLIKCECHFFYGIGDCFKFSNVRTMTDENILKIPVKNLSENSTLVKNLYWLIPLCIDGSVDKPVQFTGVYPK